MFDKNYRCASSKSAAIVKKVIEPIITKEMKENIGKMSFVTLMTDASNRQDIKLLPVLLRGYVHTKGVIIYKLSIQRIDNERAVTISDILVRTANTWNILDKVIAFGSDNCPTNFGGPERNGVNNVFALLKQKLGRDLFGLGCLFHIVGNSAEAAASVLPYDIAAIIERMFKHFHINAVRAASLQSICEDSGIIYKKLTRHSNVRYLTLLSSIQRITGMFAAVRDFFMNHTNDCPTILRQFFETDYALFWLLFLEGHLELTFAYILKIEAKEPASFEVAAFVYDLLMKFKDRKSACFISFNAQPEFRKLTDQRQSRAKHFISAFYKTFSWCILKGKLDWNKISESLQFIFEKIGMFAFKKINRDGIFDEINSINTFIDKSLEQWTEASSTVERWNDVIKYADETGLNIANMKLLVDYL